MAQFHLKKEKVDWRRGSSELISMAIVFPMIFMLIFAIIGVIQIGLVRQTLEYTAYLSGRAAVVCETEEQGKAEAISAARTALANSTFGIDVDEVDVELNLVGGTTSTESAGITWEKGALLECKISVPAQQYYTFAHGSMSSTIYMMVERPARTYT